MEDRLVEDEELVRLRAVMREEIARAFGIMASHLELKGNILGEIALQDAADCVALAQVDVERAESEGRG